MKRWNISHEELIKKLKVIEKNAKFVYADDLYTMKKESIQEVLFLEENRGHVYIYINNGIILIPYKISLVAGKLKKILKISETKMANGEDAVELIETAREYQQALKNMKIIIEKQKIRLFFL